MSYRLLYRLRGELCLSPDLDLGGDWVFGSTTPVQIAVHRVSDRLKVAYARANLGSAPTPEPVALFQEGREGAFWSAP